MEVFFDFPVFSVITFFNQNLKRLCTVCPSLIWNNEIYGRIFKILFQIVNGSLSLSIVQYMYITINVYFKILRALLKLEKLRKLFFVSLIHRESVYFILFGLMSANKSIYYNSKWGWLRGCSQGFGRISGLKIKKIKCCH